MSRDEMSLRASRAESADAGRATCATHLCRWWPAYTVFAAACALRLWLLFSTGLVPQTDGAYYLAQVRSILGGRGLRFSDTPLLFWIQAGVARFLMLAASLDARAAVVTGVKLADSLVPPLVLFPVYAMWLRWAPAERRNTLVAITVAALPSLSFCSVKMTGDLQKNSFALVLLAVTVLCFDRASRGGRKLDWALMWLALSACALSHAGVLAAAMVFLLPALMYRMAAGAGDGWARPASRTGRKADAAVAAAAALALAVGLLFVGSLFLAKLESLGRAALSPLGLFSGETVVSRLAEGGGPAAIPDALAVILAYASVALAAVAWRQSSGARPAAAATLVGVTVCTVVLAFPLLGGLDGLRLHLMAYVPAGILFAWALDRLRPAHGVAACASILLVNAFAALPVIPQAKQPTIVEESYSELVSLRDAVQDTVRETGRGRTVVVARHGLEWWAAWVFDAAVVPTIGATRDLWSRYDSVLLLQETKVWDRSSRPRRDGAQGRQFRPGAAPVVGADIIFEGDWYRLSRADKPLVLGMEFEGEPRPGQAPMPRPPRQ